MRFFVFGILLTLSCVHAFHLDTNKNIQYLLKQNLSSYKTSQILLHPNRDSRLDLFALDIIEQAQNIISKHGDFFDKREFRQLIGSHPIKNFASIYAQIQKWGESKFKKKFEQIIAQEYLSNSHAQLIPLAFHKKNRFTRFRRIRNLTKYNAIAQLPEGGNILRFINLQLSSSNPFLTVESFAKLKPSKIKRLKEKYLSLYAQKLRETDFYQAVDFGYFQYFSYRINPKKSDPLRVRIYSEEGYNNHLLGEIEVKIRNEVLPLFKNIQKSSDKNSFILYLKKQHPEIPLTKTAIRGNIQSFLLGPALILKYNTQVFQAFRNYQLAKSLVLENDQTINKVRTWLKKNKKDFEAKTLQSFYGKKPTRTAVIALTPYLLRFYPGSPWYKDEVFLNSHYQLRLNTTNFLARMAYSSSTFFKNTFSYQNILSAGAGIALTGITGNPFLGIIGYSLTYDSLYAARYNKKLVSELKNSPRRILTGAVLTAGVVPGMFAHAVFIGGAAGSLQAFFSGRPIDLGVIVGGAYEGILVTLPLKFSNLNVNGLNKNAINGLIEIAQTSFHSSVKGFIIAGLDDGDVLKGTKEGAIFGATTAGIKILLLGFRYNPRNLVTQEMIDEYIENEHNPVVSDRAYDGNGIKLSKRAFDRVTWRKDSFLRLITNARSFETAGMSSIAAKDISDTETLIHESLHFAQEIKFGAANFYYQYLRSMWKFGASIFEDYVFCENGACSP